VADLRVQVGPGDARRPTTELRATASEWVAEAAQAMRWVADERGLGGARVLDGMSWDLPVDEVWEAWVDAFVSDLAPRCGLTALRRGTTTRRRVRLVLVGLPFGFRSPAHREATLGSWRELLGG
jgi:hypothetical protein